MKITIIAAAASLVLSLAGARALAPSAGVANAETLQSRAPEAAPQVVAASTPMGCADAILCVGTCKPGDVECVSACEREVKQPAERTYRALVQCADTNRCEGDGSCARKHCSTELGACIGEGGAL